MKVNEAFEKVIWINCPQRPQRYKNMVRRLKEHDIEAEHMKCIQGCSSRALDLPYTSKRKLNCGELGCFYSHRIIYERMKKEKWDSVLILEDDAFFVHNFSISFESIIFPKDWELFYLGRGNYTGDYEQYDEARGLEDIGLSPVYFAPDSWLTHAYAIHARGIDKVLNATSQISEGLDCVLSKAMTKENWRVYTHYPYLINQDGTPSMLRILK